MVVLLAVLKARAAVAKLVTSRLRVTKQDDRGGVHMHQLAPNGTATAQDGAHRHAFQLPDGELVITDFDGAHIHEIEGGAIVEGGEHPHAVTLGSQSLETGASVSAHTHTVQASMTAVDGLHIHTLELPDGTKLESLLPEDLAKVAAGKLGELTDLARRTMTMIGGAPFASECCGIPLLIDRPKGFIQRGTAPDGTTFERQYKVDYGFIEGTAGGDGEGLDVFVGEEDAAPVAFFIVQQKDGGGFDEFKLMLGFPDAESAKAAYFAHVPRKYFASLSEVNVEALKALLGIEPTDADKAIDELAKALLIAGAEPIYQPKILDGSKRLCKSVGITKAEQQIITGVVLEPDVVDAQKDTYSAEEVEKTAHLWMADFRNISIQHKAFVNDKVDVVESWLLRTEQTIGGVLLPMGTWLIAVHVLDAELWRQAKAGELDGFSIAGFAEKTPI